MQHSNTKKSKIIFEALAEVVKEQRISKNKSMRLLADEFDIQRSLLSRIENGINEPKMISIWTICEVLGMKPSELFSKIENKLPNDFKLLDD